MLCTYLYVCICLFKKLGLQVDHWVVEAMEKLEN